MTRRISILSALILCLGPSLAQAQNSVVFTTNTTIDIGDTTHDGKDVIVRGCTVTIDGPHTFSSLVVESNGGTAGRITHSQGSILGLNLTILGNASILPGNSIDVAGRGYGPGQGPGRGWSDAAGWGSGASHGGRGGGSSYDAAFGATYGSYSQPNLLGSGGGGPSGSGFGGGLVRLTVGGNLNIQGGIYADGLNGNVGGGGSGGSIRIQANQISGGGLLRASGGPTNYGQCGSGGGGRIAVYATVTPIDVSSFCNGSPSGSYGGAGTVYTKIATSSKGLLRFDNAYVTGGRTEVQSAVIPDDVLISTNTYLAYPKNYTGFHWQVQGNLTIEAMAGFDVSGLGSAAQKGEGRGYELNGVGTGASYGGNGGRSDQSAETSLPFGSFSQPVDFGSGGGGPNGGSGGGALRLSITGTFDHDGRIFANGNNGGTWGGGGAGGSLWITAGRLQGNGFFQATGGYISQGQCGSGGGGRIALHTNDYAFLGQTDARGGTNGNWFGGPGTIYLNKGVGQSDQLIYDNGGGAAKTTIASLDFDGDLIIRGRATLQNFLSTPLAITLAGDLVLEGEGSIDLSGRGFPAWLGPGAGIQPPQGWGTGASYGGRGGRSNSTAQTPNPYGTPENPIEMGSGGGGLNGGAGGGALNIEAQNVRLAPSCYLKCNGIIPSAGGGAGSGGGIKVIAQNLEGFGVIQANGGPGNWNEAGAGGGGRIAVFGSRANWFGFIQVFGSASGWDSEDGTIYYGSLGSSISGIVALEGFAGSSGPTTVTFEFRNPGTSTIVDTKTVPLAADGSYTVIAPGSGQYDISTKIANWLRRTRNVNMASGNVTAFHFSLLNGDCDDDNEVGIGDYSLISGAFGTVIGDAGYDPAADVDWDGEIGIGDYSLLSANFGMTGDE